MTADIDKLVRDEFKTLRQQMVQYQLAARGLTDERVLNALAVVPREAFVPEDLAPYAYEDRPLPIEASQTISQPYIVGLMTAALELRSDDRILEIGTGSGYAAAVLAEICAEVYTVERHWQLAESARERLAALGYDNVHVKQGDGTLGWPEHAPYDGIIVAAGAPRVPEPLTEQLAIGGRLVIPVGPTLETQELLRVRRTGENSFEQDDLGAVRFVPLIGEAGWREKEDDAP